MARRRKTEDRRVSPLTLRLYAMEIGQTSVFDARTESSVRFCANRAAKKLRCHFRVNFCGPEIRVTRLPSHENGYGRIKSLLRSMSIGDYAYFPVEQKHGIRSAAYDYSHAWGRTYATETTQDEVIVQRVA